MYLPAGKPGDTKGYPLWVAICDTIWVRFLPYFSVCDARGRYDIAAQCKIPSHIAHYLIKILSHKGYRTFFALFSCGIAQVSPRDPFCAGVGFNSCKACYTTVGLKNHLSRFRQLPKLPGAKLLCLGVVLPTSLIRNLHFSLVWPASSWLSMTKIY